MRQETCALKRIQSLPNLVSLSVLNMAESLVPSTACATKTYGRQRVRPPCFINGVRQGKADIFSDSDQSVLDKSSSVDSVENVRPKRNRITRQKRRSAEQQCNGAGASLNRKQSQFVLGTSKQGSLGALVDISNVPSKKALSKDPTRKQVAASASNFDSFDKYDLVVCPVTPLKTRISTSVSTLDDAFNPGQFDAHSSPVFISPLPHSPLSAKVSSSCSGASRHSSVYYDASSSRITRSAARLNPSLADALIMPFAWSAKQSSKRILVNTSTPDQTAGKIQSRILESPAEQMHHMSFEDELSASLNVMSIHEEPDQPLLSSDAQMSVRASLNDSLSSNLSLFSTDERSCCQSFKSTSSLVLFSEESWSSNHTSRFEQILEEEEQNDEGEGDDGAPSSTSSAEPESNSPLTGAGYFTAESGNEYCTPEHEDSDHMRSIHESDEKLEAFNELKALSSPTLEDVATKKRQRTILRECAQSSFLSWQQYLSSSHLSSIVKVGEGVYGEVFRARQDKDSTIVIKIVPMQGKCTVNDEPQKTFADMTKEILITKHLSAIGYNFIQLHRAVCVQGTYPDVLIQEWDKFNQCKGSENDRPDYFPEEQHYAVFEFSDGGCDLESFKFENASQGLSVLKQVAWSMALAEEDCEFEHRDLHWGNVLILPSDQQFMAYSWRGSTSPTLVPTYGVKAHIIDFTLSRLRLGHEVIYSDLSRDESLFQGKGDFQFDVYRQMRQNLRDSWRDFHGPNNILWLNYLADKLLKMKTFPSLRGQELTSTQLKKHLVGLLNRTAGYFSAMQLVCVDELFHEVH